MSEELMLKEPCIFREQCSNCNYEHPEDCHLYREKALNELTIYELVEFWREN